MNLVIDDAYEVKQKVKAEDIETRRPLGASVPPELALLPMILTRAQQILLKGDNVSLIQSMSS